MTAPIESRDPRVDAYIAAAAPFARPILAHLRDVIHRACPDVRETIKWSMPFFDYRGPLCNMAAFKAHCAFGFWRGSEIVGLPSGGDEAMGQLGRIAALDDLPAHDVLTGFVQAAMKINESQKKPRAKAMPRPDLAMPDDFAAALREHVDASKRFDAFGPGARRDYLEWIVDAKREATRAARIATAVAWIAEGKTRNWKYQR